MAEQMAETASTETAPQLKCKKCGRPYERGGKWLTRHEEKCDGTPWTPDQAPARTRPRDPAPEPAPNPPPAPPPTAVEILMASAQAALAERLEKRAALDAQRDAVQLEIDELNLTIAAIGSVKLVVDKSLVTSKCGDCNSTIDQLKAAQWDKFDADTQKAKLSDHNRRMNLWLNETVRLMRLKIRIPSPEELERQYPMIGTERTPAPPRVADPRPAPVVQP